MVPHLLPFFYVFLVLYSYFNFSICNIPFIVLVSPVAYSSHLFMQCCLRTLSSVLVLTCIPSKIHKTNQTKKLKLGPSYKREPTMFVSLGLIYCTQYSFASFIHLNTNFIILFFPLFIFNCFYCIKHFCLFLFLLPLFHSTLSCSTHTLNLLNKYCFFLSIYIHVCRS